MMNKFILSSLLVSVGLISSNAFALGGICPDVIDPSIVPQTSEELAASMLQSQLLEEKIRANVAFLGSAATPGRCAPITPVRAQPLAECTAMMALLTKNITEISLPCTPDINPVSVEPFSACKFTAVQLIDPGHCPPIDVDE